MCAFSKINAYRDRFFSVQDYSAVIENMLLAIVEPGMPLERKPLKKERGLINLMVCK